MMPTLLSYILSISSQSSYLEEVSTRLYNDLKSNGDGVTDVKITYIKGTTVIRYNNKIYHVSKNKIHDMVPKDVHAIVYGVFLKEQMDKQK